MKPLLLAALLLAGPCAADRPLRGAPPASSLRRGTWVYRLSGRPLTQVEGGTQKLLELSRELDLTELYVSVGAAPLGDPRTPALVRALKSARLRVEALVSSPDVDREVDALLGYNRRQPRDARFDGLHYDYEPWIGSGRDSSWAETLLKVYPRARERLRGTGLSFSADISAVKLESLEPAVQRRLFEAASRLVLMAYEAPAPVVHRRSKNLLREGAPWPGELMVAIRVKDFGAGSCSLRRVLDSLDEGFRGAARYVGWATFSFNDHLDPELCPGDCCTRSAPTAPAGGSRSAE